MTNQHQDIIDCLTLTNLGVAFADRVILSDVNLTVPAKGFMALVGPSGTGKSTLLRTIAGHNENRPSVQVWGTAEYCGKPISDQNTPVLVGQNTRLLTSSLLENLLYGTAEQFASTPEQKRARAMENLKKVGLEQYEKSLDQRVVELPLLAQRLVAITRALANNPPLILIDEPTFGLEDDDVTAILDVIQEQAKQRAILVVLHNQQQIRSLGGRTALMAGGVVQETQATTDFFKKPLTIAGGEFIVTGTCSEPSPDARQEDLDTGIRPRLRPLPETVCIPSETLGPRGFVWLIPGKLAGTPRPGIVKDLAYDLAALTRVGVSTLISTMSSQVTEDELMPYGITSKWFPIPDMEAPDYSTAVEICKTIDRLIDDSKVIAVHCRAGMGRTGTILVAYLIWTGQSAMAALESARRIEPKWVQSDMQIQFLDSFAIELLASRAEEPTKALHKMK